MKEKIEKVLDAVRPVLQADGGSVELVAVEGAIVKVRLQGACGNCPMATVTLKQVIEKKIKEAIPEIESVEAV
ncbi:NifU family protein [bacterium]|nr:NifU family protein [bacterium]